MKKYYRFQMEYNNWANREIAQYFLEKNRDIPAALRLVSHIVNAHHVWNSRIEGVNPVHGVWDVHSPEKIIEIQSQNFENSLGILKTKRVETAISYKNLKGEKFVSQVWEIFTHVNYHCVYHRGQIAMLLRENNFAPPVTDYIYYRRMIDRKY